MKPKLLVIVGPTGVGKTALSIELAQAFDGLIVNGDSMQIYRGLDIGTAKPSLEERKGIPHYLMDSQTIHQPYSASDFQDQARAAIQEIQAQGKLPILVGGTGLYIEGLLYDFHFSGPDSLKPGIREQVAAMLADQGPQVLWDRLRDLDPEAAQAIPVNNTRRVSRAMEVTLSSGQKFSSFEKSSQASYDAFVIGLNTQRDLLYDRINQRVVQMTEQGLEQEAKWLYQEDPQGLSQAFKGIGYKEWVPYFEGQASLDQVIATIQQNSRRYAKRQLTWFRNRLDQVHWFDLVKQPEDLSLIKEQVAHFLTNST